VTPHCGRFKYLINNAVSLPMSVFDKIKLVKPDYMETLKTAYKYGITFYDAIYVQLAIDHSDTLVTEIKSLRRRSVKMLMFYL